jgi:Flp pilus assembly protein TadD
VTARPFPLSTAAALPSAEPTDAPSLARLIHQGSERLRDGSPAAARELLDQAVKIAPDNVAARHLLALALFQSGHLERALVLYEALLLEFPSSAAAKINLAVVLLKLGRASPARALLEEIVRADPEHRRAWGYLGVALEQLGLIADAEGAFIAGHFASAAKRLRERHSEKLGAACDAEKIAFAPSRRRTLPPDAWALGSRGSLGSVQYPAMHTFTTTLRPTDASRGSITPPSRPTRRALADLEADGLEEIPIAQTIAPAHGLLPPPPALSNAPKPNRPVVPLLDAALSSLLVLPHEASVAMHPTGLVLIGLERANDAHDGGFAALASSVLAIAGPLRRAPLARRAPPAPEPFRDAPFVRVSGAGKLVLAPPRGARLLPLEMDADVAFVREQLVVAFDASLLCDLGRVRGARGAELRLVRFRGDGVIVVALDRPFLAFDVHGDESLVLQSDALIGWIGALVPEPAADDDALVTLTGEGTVLFHAPHDD